MAQIDFTALLSCNSLSKSLHENLDKFLRTTGMSQNLFNKLAAPTSNSLISSKPIYSNILENP